MNEKIRKKIESINNGELPEGYKNTEFGVFPFDWVTDKRLGDIGVFDKGKGIPGNKLVSAGVPCVGYGDIYMKYNHCFNKAQSFVDEETAKESLPIGKGTLLFTCTRETADEIGKCVCYNGEETIYAGGDILTFSSKEVSTMFLTYQQHLPFAIVQKARLGQGHSVVHIHKENLESLNVAFPSSTKEQETITEILMKQEHVIDLYKQKAEQLKRLKKIALQKMFPKHGSNVPEWRFPGFINPWEQRKFSDITYPSGEKNRDNLPYESYSITNENGFVPQDEKFENGGTMRDADKRMYYIVSPQSFAYNPARINVGSIGYQNTSKNVIVSSLYEVFKTTEAVDDCFLWHWFKSDDFQKLIVQLQEGGVRLYFYYDKLCMGTIALPGLAEQRKIGDYLDKLDDLITLHQRLQEEEKKKLKSLMRLLLTGIVRV